MKSRSVATFAVRILPPGPNIKQGAMTTTPLPAEALASCDADVLLPLCEQAEQSTSPHPFPTEHLLSLLLVEDMHEARFLWMRLSPSARQLASPVWQIVKPILCDDRQSLLKAAREVSVEERLQPMVSEVLRRERVRTAGLIADSFDVVSVGVMCGMMGVDHGDADAVRQTCDRYGWSVEGEFIVVDGSRGLEGQGDGLLEDAMAVSGDADGRDCDDVKKVNAFMELQNLTEQLVRLQTT